MAAEKKESEGRTPKRRPGYNNHQEKKLRCWEPEGPQIRRPVRTKGKKKVRLNWQEEEWRAMATSATLLRRPKKAGKKKKLRLQPEKKGKISGIAVGGPTRPRMIGNLRSSRKRTTSPC